MFASGRVKMIESCEQLAFRDTVWIKVGEVLLELPLFPSLDHVPDGIEDVERERTDIQSILVQELVEDVSRPDIQTPRPEDSVASSRVRDTACGFE